MNRHVYAWYVKLMEPVARQIEGLIVSSGWWQWTEASRTMVTLVVVAAGVGLVVVPLINLLKRVLLDGEWPRPMALAATLLVISFGFLMLPIVVSLARQCAAGKPAPLL